jgi:hypothetical protein
MTGTAPYVPPAVATTNNRTNTGGQLAGKGGVRVGTTINSYLAPGATSQYPVAGDRFYVRASSAAINIRPTNDSFDQYTPGTGKVVDPSNLFRMIEVMNPSANPVSFSIFVGFGDFIDHRLIIEQDTVSQIQVPVYSPTPPAAGPINIPDLSGGVITDQNGVQWLALSRVAFYVDNLDTVSNLVLQNSDSDGTSQGIIFPATTRTFLGAGDFTLKNGSATINAGVQALYSAIVPTFPV